MPILYTDIGFLSQIAAHTASPNPPITECSSRVMTLFHGCTLMLCNKDRSVEKERNALHTLIGQNVSGIILFKTELPASEILQITRTRPIVLMDVNPSAYENYDYVNIDDAAGIRLALSHIMEMGHRRIGFVAGPPDSYSSSIRVNTYLSTMKDMNLEVPDGYLQHGTFHVNGGRSCIERMLNLPMPPTAVLAANDLTAIGVMLRASEMGFRIPEDLSVVGYDDISPLQYVRPALTTVWQPKYEMGRAAADLLIQRVNSLRAGENLPCQSIQLDTHFIRRESLSAPRNSY